MKNSEQFLVRDFSRKLWKTIQVLATLAGLTGITLISLGKLAQPLQIMTPYFAVVSTGLVFILIAQLFLKENEIRLLEEKAKRENVIIKGREHINQVCIQLMNSARYDIATISGDLSWLPNNFETLKNARERVNEIRILYRCSDVETVINNARYGRAAEADMACYRPSRDPKIRFLLVDRQRPEAVLLVFKKRSRPFALNATIRDGTPGDPSIFEYQAEVYTVPKHEVLIHSVSQFFDRLWNESYELK